jgi:hypothetical protein
MDAPRARPHDAGQRRRAVLATAGLDSPFAGRPAARIGAPVTVAAGAAALAAAGARLWPGAAGRPGMPAGVARPGSSS